VAGVCCERRRSAQDVKETFQKGPNAGGEGLVPTPTHRRGAHRDLTSDRGHGQGETGGATALTRASSGTRMTSLAHVPVNSILILLVILF